MKHRGVAVRAAVAGLLGAVLAVEILLPGPGVPVTMVRGTPIAAGADRAAPAGVARQAQAILARPLFRADRRPVPRPGKTGTALPRLSAIIVTQGARRAIFAGEGKPLIVGLGGRVGSYRLDAIGPERIRLSGPDGRIVLRPQFSNGRPSIRTAALPRNIAARD